MTQGMGTQCPEHPRALSAPPPWIPPTDCWARAPTGLELCTKDERRQPQEGWHLGLGALSQATPAGHRVTMAQCHLRSRSRRPDTEQLCLHLRGLGAARGGPLTFRSWLLTGTGACPMR